MKNLMTIVSVVTNEGDLLWHTRQGLSEDEDKATRFKSLEHALKLCRKKYSRQLGRELREWKASEI